VITQFAHRAREVLLRPLSEAAGRQLADLLIPPGALDEATKHGLVTQAEGNALYLEEPLKSVAQRGPRDSPATWTISLRDLLPSSLEGLFLARVDRLTPSARMLLQQAAAIGREFPVAILERLPGDSHVRDDLAVLLRADLIRELRRYPEFVCTFRHGLLQETVMSTLTPDRVRRLYGQVGKAYEEVYADSLEARLEQAAFYFYRSDEPARALPYLERAAQAALAAGAPSNAKRLLTRAEKLATALADDATRARVADQLSALSGALADSNPSMQR